MTFKELPGRCSILFKFQCSDAHFSTGHIWQNMPITKFKKLSRKTIPTHWEWCHVFLSLRCCWWVWHSTCQQLFLTACRVCLLILVNKDAVAMSPLLGNSSIPRHSLHYINDNSYSQARSILPQDSVNEFIIRKLNPLVVVDFRIISAFLHVYITGA